MAVSDDSPISAPGAAEGAPVRRTPILTEPTPKEEIEDAVEVPAPATEPAGMVAAEAAEPQSGTPDEADVAEEVFEEDTASPAVSSEAAGSAAPVAAAALAAAAGAAAGAAAASGGGPAGPPPGAGSASPPPSSGGSGFGRVVTAGVAAVIGGVIAIAAQPFLAPYLGAPAGQDPAVLADLSERVTKLEGGAVQLAANTRAIAALQAAAKTPAPPPPAGAPAAVPADLDGRLSELVGRVEALTGQGAVITRLTGELGAQSGDLATLKTRLETMATAISSASGDITALKERLDALAAADESTAGTVAGLQAALVALDGRLGAAVGVAAELQARVDTVEGTKGGALGDRSLASVALALSAFARDLEAGLPYAGPLAVLKPVLLEPAPATVVAAAATGLPTTPALRAAFESAAPDLDIAVTRAEGGGDLVNRLMASARTLVRVRSTEPGAEAPAQNPVEVIRAALALGDLPAALAAAEALPPQAGAGVADWTKQLKARVDAAAFLNAAGAQFLARLSAAGN